MQAWQGLPANPEQFGMYLALKIGRRSANRNQEVIMKTSTRNRLLALALCGLLAPVQAAAESATTTASRQIAPPCRMLMTELECSRHTSALAQLEPGPARDRYLAEIDAMLRDREAACSCNRQVMAETIYPPRHTTLRQF